MSFYTRRRVFDGNYNTFQNVPGTAVTPVPLQPLGTVATASTIPAVSNGGSVTATLTNGNLCAFTLPAMAAGTSFRLYVSQPLVTGTGTYSFAAPTGYTLAWPAGTAPSMTQGGTKVDRIDFSCPDGYAIYGTFSQGFPVTPPPQYDNSATSTRQSAVASGTAMTMSYTAAANAAVVVGVVGSIASGATATVTFGGQTMTAKGLVYDNNNTALTGLWVFTLLNQSGGSGAQTLSVTITQSGTFSGYLFPGSYNNVTAIGSLQSAYGFSSSASLAATASAATDILWGALATTSGITYSSFDLTQRQAAAGGPEFVMGDTTGVTSKTISATLSASTQWAVAALDIQ